MLTLFARFAVNGFCCLRKVVEKTEYNFLEFYIS